MKIEGDKLEKVLQPGVKKLSDLFSKHGYELRIAGGAVRDLLNGKIPHDLDFATTATPAQMKDMFKGEGVRMINETGEKHGTITARIEEENYECTTLRIDVVTDGRHAEVQFTTDWELDANRRDLTINSMFMGLDGTVYDYFEGSKHLKEKHITFVGDPDKRIKEDYLRILRYFRFYGRIAETPDNHCPEVLNSIRENADGLKRISGERIWGELKKIVSGNFGGELLVKMIECGLGPCMGFTPNSDQIANVRSVFAKCEEAGINVKEMNPMTLLASGFSNEEECIEFVNRVKCSKREREVLYYIVKYRDLVLQASSVKVIQDHIADLIIDERRNKDIAFYYVNELLQYTCQLEYLKEIQEWTLPKFPLNGHMIGMKGVPRKKTKFALKDLLEEWKKSNFTMNSEELMNTLDVESYQ